MSQMHPSWYHYNGVKISQIGINSANSPTRKVLILGSKTVGIKIHRDPQGGYLIKYEIHHPSDTPTTWGKISMSEIEIQKAFGLSGKCNGEDEQQIPGKYIKHGRYLNIPGPGTGKDGDPNISIYLDEALVSNVRAFLD